MSGTLRLTHSTLRRGRTRVLEPGRLEFPAGAVIGVVGLNGAGKTTLLMSVAGVLTHHPAAIELERPGSGERILDPDVGYAPQHPAVPAWLTAGDTIRLLGAGIETLRTRAAGLAVDEFLGRRNRALSGGQRQALSLALALGSGAPLLVLDEPFAALDMRRRRGLMDDVLRLAASPEPPTLVLSAQSAGDLNELCSHYVVLGGGRYAFVGPRDVLLAAAGAGNGRSEIERLERTILEHAAAVPTEVVSAPAGLSRTFTYRGQEGDR